MGASEYLVDGPGVDVRHDGGDVGDDLGAAPRVLRELGRDGGARQAVGEPVQKGFTYHWSKI